MEPSSRAGPETAPPVAPAGGLAAPGGERVSARLARFFFGDDVFVSYARADATDYSLALAGELTRRGVSCFLDQWGTPPGDELPASLLRALRRSTMLVLLGTERAARSEAVRREVEAFLRTGRPIIPVSFGGALERAEWFPLVRGLSLACEPVEALRTGEPSEDVVTRVVNAEGFTRRNLRLRRVFWGTVAAVAVALAAGGVMVRRAVADLRFAQAGGRLELAGTDALRQFRSGAGELVALRSALAAGEELRTLVAGVDSLHRYPTVSPVFALQTIVDGIRERRVFPTGGARVRAVALRPDGRVLAIVTGDRLAEGESTLQLWRPSGGRPFARWALPRGGVGAVGFTPDGGRVVTVAGDDAVQLWDLEGRLLRRWTARGRATLSPRGDRIALARNRPPVRLVDLAGGPPVVLERDFLLAFRPDGGMIVSAGTDAVVLRDVRGEPVARWKAPGPLAGIGFGSGGERVVGVSPDGAVYVWSLSGERLARWDAGRVRRFALGPAAPSLATLGSGGEVRLWSLEGEERARLVPHAGRTLSLAFTPGGRELVTAGADGVVQLWDPAGNPVLALHGHRGGVEGLRFSADGRLVVTADEAGAVRLWSLDARPAVRLGGGDDPVLGVAVAPDREGFVSAGPDGALRWWDAAGREVRRTRVPVAPAPWAHAARFGDDGRHVLVSSGAGRRLWRLGGGGPVEVGRAPGREVVAFDVHPDGERVVVAEAGGPVALAGAEGGGRVVFRGHRGWVYAVRFAPGGTRVVTGGADGTVRTWDLAGREVARFESGQGQVLDLRFGPDGRTLATAGADGSVRLWSPGGEPRQRFVGHAGRVLAVRFSPDGERLASLATDGTVRLWDLAGRPLAELPSHQGASSREARGGDFGTRGLAFSRDGRRLAVAGDDGVVRVWAVGGLTELLERGRVWLGAEG